MKQNKTTHFMCIIFRPTGPLCICISLIQRKNYNLIKIRKNLHTHSTKRNFLKDRGTNKKQSFLFLGVKWQKGKSVPKKNVWYIFFVFLRRQKVEMNVCVDSNYIYFYTVFFFFLILVLIFSNFAVAAIKRRINDKRALVYPSPHLIR